VVTALFPLFSTLRLWLRPLVEPRFWVLLLLLTAGTLLLAQRPLAYPIAIGQEDGPGADLPFAVGWNDAERSGETRYRWSADESFIYLAGLPRDVLVVTLRLLNTDQHPEVATGVTTVTTPMQRLGTVPLGKPRTLHLLVPPAALTGGQLDLQVYAPIWTPSGDPRVLGVPVSDLGIASASGPEWSGPSDVPLALLWPLPALVIVYVALRRWLRTQSAALAVVALAGVFCLALMATDRLRFALAGQPVLIAATSALVASICIHVLLRWFTPSWGIRASPRLLGFLVVLFFGLFTLRYAGRLYPFSMRGDIGFHINRQNDVLRGDIMLVSNHRGIAFPYPPSLYLLLLPLRLLPISADVLVDFADAFLGALGLFPVAFLALHGTGKERPALLAAGTYVLLAPSIMALWWSFLPHIFAQELAVALLAGLAGGWALIGTRKGITIVTAAFALLFTSHFGFYLNISILVALLLLANFVLARARKTEISSSTWGLLIAFGCAQVLVVGLFYSGYAALIIDKLMTFSEGGMGAVQGGREPRSAAMLLRSLWRDGLGAHYAVIGVPLALLGSYRLFTARVRGMTSWLFGATLVVVFVLAAIPFVTASDISTRWLSFAAWVVALGLGLLLDALWSRGRLARLLAVATIGWIGWTTAWMWLQALAFRVRPPEPF
jgi:hypothetical protein